MVHTFFEGILQISNVFLSIVAGLIALTLFKKFHQNMALRPWKWLTLVLCLFAVEEILGALRSFAIWSSPFMTHIVPSFMLLFLIIAITMEIIYIKHGEFL